MARGYEAVGMRDIARAVGRQPIQIYRLNLSKSDLLAEVILELNQQEINQLPALCAQVRGGTLREQVADYFRALYQLDIEFLAIRSVGAAYGWLWSPAYEARITQQVGAFLAPIAGWMTQHGLDDVPARCYGLWSVFYVGFRRAAVRGGSAEDCIAEIRPALDILLRPDAGHGRCAGACGDAGAQETRARPATDGLVVADSQETGA
jgi:AcrR family transcriptional regulator